MFDIRTLLIAIPALPLLAAVFTALCGPKLLREKSHWPAAVAIGLSLVCSLLLLNDIRGEIQSRGGGGFAQVETLWTWATVDNAIPAPDAAGNSTFKIDVSLRADSFDGDHALHGHLHCHIGCRLRRGLHAW